MNEDLSSSSSNNGIRRDVCGITLSVPGFKKARMMDIAVSRLPGYSLHVDAQVDEWISERLKDVRLNSDVMPIRNIEKWKIDPSSGNISHTSGRFFTITGIFVRHRSMTEELEWDQPIIDQPEIGILGIMATKINDVLHFCLQAKEEPGNINSVQLSPTVQATYSNYTGVHGGSLPRFTELFIDPPKGSLFYAKLQTEDGGRFLYKSNRNMIVTVDFKDYAELPGEFIWLTLRQINLLMRRDNLVNSCARSVLTCLI